MKERRKGERKQRNEIKKMKEGGKREGGNTDKLGTKRRQIFLSKVFLMGQ